MYVCTCEGWVLVWVWGLGLELGSIGSVANNTHCHLPAPSRRIENSLVLVSMTSSPATVPLSLRVASSFIRPSSAPKSLAVFWKSLSALLYLARKASNWDSCWTEERSVCVCVWVISGVSVVCVFVADWRQSGQFSCAGLLLSLLPWARESAP